MKLTITDDIEVIAELFGSIPGFYVSLGSFSFDVDYEQSFFRLVRRAWRESKPREKNSMAARTPGAREKQDFTRALSRHAWRIKQKRDYW